MMPPDTQKTVRPSPWSERAFTLPELLVTMVVVLVLFAVLLPVLSRMVLVGKDTKCASNLRTYGMAIFLLVADEGRLQDGKGYAEGYKKGEFHNWLKPYLPTRLRCPLVTSEFLRDGSKQNFNYAGSHILAQYYPSLSGIPAPSSRVILATELYSYEYFNSPSHFNATIWGNSDGKAAAGSRTPQYHGTPENRGLHVFFLDGHIKRVAAIDNDWWLKPTKAPYDGTDDGQGYLYERTQFLYMKERQLTY